MAKSAPWRHTHTRTDASTSRDPGTILSDVTVAQTTTAGQPTLTLTATAPAMPSGYQEQLVIGADTGIPVRFEGGSPAKPEVTVSDDVTRVSTGDLTAGH